MDLSMRNDGVASAELRAPFLIGMDDSRETTALLDPPSQRSSSIGEQSYTRTTSWRDTASTEFDHAHLPTASGHYRYTKRMLDLALSLLLLPLIAALLLLIAIGVACTSGWPIFYRQRRLGQHGTTFEIIKFRTMRHKASQVLTDWLAAHPKAQREWQETHKLKDDPRITRFGRFLRETSLDELPQIFNVLLGDMSLIGPRPIVQAERVRYKDSFAFYSAARPGITGLWQISGRNNVTYDERVRMDERYVRDWTLEGDLRILLRTPKSVFFRDGAY